MKRSPATILTLVAALLVGMASGQSYQPPRCVTFADECRPYLNNWYEQPSRACCNQVEMTIRNDFQCFCSLYRENRWSYWFEINYVKTLQLPSTCNLYFNLNDCPNQQWGSGGYQQPPPTQWGGFGGSQQNAPPAPPMGGGFGSPQAAPPSFASAPAPVSEAPISLPQAPSPELFPPASAPSPASI